MWSSLWKCSPLSTKHSSLHVMFVLWSLPNRTPINIGVRLRKVMEEHPYTLYINCVELWVLSYKCEKGVGEKVGRCSKMLLKILGEGPSSNPIEGPSLNFRPLWGLKPMLSGSIRGQGSCTLTHKLTLKECEQYWEPKKIWVILCIHSQAHVLANSLDPWCQYLIHNSIVWKMLVQTIYDKSRLGMPNKQNKYIEKSCHNII